MTLLRLTVALFFLLLVAACGAIATPVAKIPTEVAVALTQTPPSDLVRLAGQTITFTPAGDPVRGAQLFSTFNPLAATTCSACHRADSDDRLIGPGLLNVATRAASRVPGLSAADYIRQSILDPAAYVVEDYLNIMPKTWGDALTDQDVDDLVAYLTILNTTPS